MSWSSQKSEVDPEQMNGIVSIVNYELKNLESTHARSPDIKNKSFTNGQECL